jgi:hypothetical protein
MPVSEVRRADVQDYVDRLRKKGLSGSTIANKLDPIRVIFRRALQRDDISVDPTQGLVLPSVRGRRERVALTATLHGLLVAHRARTGRSENHLVFGRTGADPFIRSTLRSRALRAWGWKEVPNPQPEGAKTVWVKARPDALDPIAPHEGRHSAASSCSPTAAQRSRPSSTPTTPLATRTSVYRFHYRNALQRSENPASAGHS